MQCIAYGNSCGSSNHFRTVCRKMQRQWQVKRSSRGGKQYMKSSRMSSPVQQSDKTMTKNFDSVNIKYLNCDNVIPVIFTNLEVSTSHKRVHITYK